MQTISGVHYNFSLPMAFWQAKCGVTDDEDAKEKVSAGYFRLIRNYYRFGWVIRTCLAHLRRFVLLSCKESRQLYRLKNGLWYVLPAVRDIAAPERFGLYQ